MKLPVAKYIKWQETTTVELGIDVDDLPQRFRRSPQKWWDIAMGLRQAKDDKEQILADTFKDFIQDNSEKSYVDGSIDEASFEIEIYNGTLD